MQVTHQSRSAIARAQLFLRLAEECPSDKRVEFEAFLEAAIVFGRAAPQRFRRQHERHPEFEEWWHGLLENPSVEFFRRERNHLLKEAPPKIGQRGFAASVGRSELTYVPTRAAEFYFFEGPDIPATDTIARHLEEMERLLQAAEARFV